MKIAAGFLVVFGGKADYTSETTILKTSKA